jgi:hypothetical protein
VAVPRPDSKKAAPADNTEARRAPAVIAPERIAQAYEELVSARLKAALPPGMRGLKLQPVCDRLRKYGLDVEPRQLRDRIREGKFSLTFAMQLLDALPDKFRQTTLAVISFEEARKHAETVASGERVRARKRAAAAKAASRKARP